MSQTEVSVERSPHGVAGVGAAGKSETMALSTGCSRRDPGWISQAFQ